MQPRVDGDFAIGPALGVPEVRAVAIRLHACAVSVVQARVSGRVLVQMSHDLSIVRDPTDGGDGGAHRGQGLASRPAATVGAERAVGDPRVARGEGKGALGGGAYLQSRRVELVRAGCARRRTRSVEDRGPVVPATIWRFS